MPAPPDVRPVVTAEETVVIVGGGQAASEIGVHLRQQGFGGAVIMLAEERYLPYQRPPLSKAFLKGSLTLEALTLRSAAMYDRLGIQVRLGTRVETIDRHDRTVKFASGERLSYGRLVIATGGRPRHLRVPGAKLGGIFYLRGIDDVEALRHAFAPGRRLTIIGGGYVGLEVAAVAVKHGLIVTLLESATRVLARVTGPELSAFYERVHRSEGVDIRTGVVVSGFVATDSGENVAGVMCGEGEAIPTDMVIVGIGMIANTELAEGAGLPVDSGILVDGRNRTADQRIYAIGDCAKHACHGFLDRAIRLESVPNALEQARNVACDVTGKPPLAVPPPWFWSDQYSLKLQMVGTSDSYDSVVLRGTTESDSFIAFYLKDGVVVAADAVNRPSDFMVAKRLVAGHQRVIPATLSDDDASLKTIFADASRNGH